MLHEPCPVTLKGERLAAIDAKVGKDAPAVQQSRCCCCDMRLRRVDDLVVVKYETMHCGAVSSLESFARGICLLFAICYLRFAICDLLFWDFPFSIFHLSFVMYLSFAKPS